jgi:putative flavoprotein involved in K+ transport
MQDLEQAAAAWLGAFDHALGRADWAGAAALFQEGGHWRDVVACSWSIESASGRAAVAAMLARLAPATRPRRWRLAEGRTAPRLVRRAGEEVLESLVGFETAQGMGSAVLRLAREGDRWRAFTLSTVLEHLHGHPEPDPARHATVDDYQRDFGGANWLDQRNAARAYAAHDPTVLVVGGGQAGLSIAARLRAQGVDTLVIDREARIGDNWRRRYHALTLHNEVHVNHLPYLPFPATWPVFIPKDMLANWFEHYVEALELNYWPGTELAGGTHDGEAWTVTLRRADGSERVMRPRHLVFATGVSGIPVLPEMPGLAEFRGVVMHSGAYSQGHAWRGKRAIVLGTGNSAHDVAQDLHAAGACVTMVQRSPTHVVSVREAQGVYSIYAEGLPMADCDLLATAMPYPVLRRAYQLSTAAGAERDRALLEGLRDKGFRLTLGEDETGFQMMYLRRGGGYYFNVGCSDLIVSGEIALVQHDATERFTAEGLRMKDGTLLAAELVVAATGYRNQQEVVRQALGDGIADRIGPVWGFDAGGELRNMWRPTAQPGLWFIAGSLAQCRIYSKFLAQQIKAREMGLV